MLYMIITPFFNLGRHNLGDRDLENDIIPMCLDMGLGVSLIINKTI